MTVPLTLVGSPGSPYSRKLRAVLRYRRIAHRWVQRGSAQDVGIPRPAVALIPVLVLPSADGGAPEAAVDTTPLIRRLETMVAERSVIPADPVLAFLDALIEDYADEWLTKAMFHYRWTFPEDIAKAGAVLPRWARIDLDNSAIAPLTEQFCSRQISRLGVVGSNATTRPVIEDSYRRLLRLLDAHLTERPFVFGGRPASADFGLFGQLSQLAHFDPTPAAIALAEAPRVWAWVDVVEDSSGIEPGPDDWIPRDPLPDTLSALLAEVGRVYAPFLIANAAALERGDDEVRLEIDGRPWTQRPFPYQGKCLKALRDGYAALDGADRRAVDVILGGTGCEALLR